jgi:hypothetical protein
MPVYCLQVKCNEFTKDEVSEKLGGLTITEYRDDDIKYSHIGEDEHGHSITSELLNRKGTWIRKGDKIGQFRIMEVMPEIEFEEVEFFGNNDRGGFGTTGSK